NKKLKHNSKKWKKIHTVTNDKKLKAKDFKKYSFKLGKETKPYRFFKLEILDNKGDTCTQLSEFKLKGTTYSSPKTKIVKAAEKGSTAINVKWEKKDGVKGYELQYSTSKKFKKAKTVTIGKASSTGKTVKKLKKGKKYYVRVRTYKVVKKVKITSKWSKKKSVKL
ncbi:MAG: fibronectin type III domain-containing protein, partial [Eubacterium sp.]|nr:fibronectin type III domain-containing protein [Eubacterium sp.]